MDQHHVLLTSGIVRRLRIVLLSISLVIVASMLIGFSQIRSLERSANQLTQSSIPILIKAEALEASLKNLLLLLQRVDRAEDPETLEKLGRGLQILLQDLRNDVDEFATGGAHPAALTTMVDVLGQIEAGALGILETKSYLLAHRSALNIRSQDALAMRKTVRAHLEKLSIELSLLSARHGGAGNRDGPAESAVGSTTGLAVDTETFVANVLWANALTSLTLEIEAAIDMALVLPNTPDARQLAQSRITMQLKIRDIVRRLGRLPASEPRADLARTIISLRALVFEPGGILDEVQGLQNRQSALQRFQSGQFEPIKTLATQSDHLIAGTYARIETARADLATTSQHMSLVLMLSTGVLLLVIFGAAVLVVERQINQRMAKLTRAVLAIADGQTEYRVAVSGPDELGKMAAALKVFKRNAKELHRSNIELEKFAYIAAHDLRSPLRAIQDLMEWTLEDEDTHFSPEGRENINLLQQRIHRLNHLLTGLLEYSRVGKRDDDLTEISIAEIVKDTAELLDPGDRYNLRFLGPAQTTITHETPLRQILLNLISNAIKHHDRPTGSITIKAHCFEHRLICSVQDDGPGIAAQYHDRVFGLFQTLRSKDEVEGSGLGLAIVQKLLEHYGGKIRVTSTPDTTRGTMFSFDLPDRSVRAPPVDQAA